MTRIRFSEAELRTGRADPEQVLRAVQAIDEDGFVALEGVVAREHIRLLRERMREDLPIILARKDVPFNFTRSNVQQDPPPLEPYLFKDVLLNEFVIAVTHAIMGDGVQNDFYSGNTALPSTPQRQPVHVDMGHLWPNMKVATPPYALVVNLTLGAVSAANGSTEIWPGTHRDTSVPLSAGDIKVDQDRLEAQRRARPPLQPELDEGTVLIRDMRLWHAGMPNPSNEPRFMLAMIHWVGWWPCGGRIKVPAAAKEFFEHPVLRTHAEFVEGEIPYLGNNTAYDLEEPS
ncbi:MAG TPA: phytanoyl-CoA dioxygenase family protein [Fimbriimonadaceae bacterium]|nr:phytanoyl-CoA dioxygenase family protein [Fimbriimonadaceae bacterium]